MKNPRNTIESEQGRHVYDLVVQGASNAELAKEIGITVRTVKYHMSRIFQDTGLSTRGQLIAAHGRWTHGRKRRAGLRDRLGSDRQREVYDLVVEGVAGPQVAGRLGITPRTVKFHCQSIMEQLNIKTQPRLIAAHWDPAVAAGSRRRGRPPKSRTDTESIVSLLQHALEDLRRKRDRTTERIEALKKSAEALG